MSDPVLIVQCIYTIDQCLKLTRSWLLYVAFNLRIDFCQFSTDAIKLFKWRPFSRTSNSTNLDVDKNFENADKQVTMPSTVAKETVEYDKSFWLI